MREGFGYFAFQGAYVSFPNPGMIMREFYLLCALKVLFVPFPTCQFVLLSQGQQTPGVGLKALAFRLGPQAGYPNFTFLLYLAH